MNHFTAVIPIVWFCTYNLVAVSALRLNYLKRKWILPLIVVFVYKAFNTIHYLTQPRGLDYAAGIGIIVQSMYIMSLLFLNKCYWSPIPSQDNSSWIKQSLRYLSTVYEVSLNLRMLRVQTTPSFWHERHSDRQDFKPLHVLQRLVLWTLFINIAFEALTLYFGEFDAQDYSTTSDVFSARHMSLRVYITISWLAQEIVLLEGTHAVCAFCAVYILGVDPPSAWPNLFGNLRDAYSLTRFWRFFWHRLHLPAYIAWSRFVVKRVGNKLFRDCFVKFLIFTVSGLAHALVSWKLGDTCTVRGDIWFYVVNCFGVLFELLVSHVVAFVPSYISGTKSKIEGFSGSSRISRIVGYLWVFTFLIWAVPSWSFPQMYCDTVASRAV